MEVVLEKNVSSEEVVDVVNNVYKLPSSMQAFVDSSEDVTAELVKPISAVNPFKEIR